MGKQIFNFKGMMRDLSVSKNPSNYAYEIRNMRLTAQEDSTLLSLVTEKGNREFAIKDASNNPVALDNIIGYCVIDKYLTVFTHKVENTSCIDSIVRLEEKYPEGSSISYMEAKVLYTGDLDLYPDKGVEIDALGCYENENLIKVYWVDSVHQPRLINIMASDDEISSWSDMETPFDFIPALGFNEEVSIQKVNYNGLFAPGTLQYVFTYYKRNGQQSNSFYTSPLYYTSHSNRGGSPEETVSSAFEIKVYNPDTTFDFVRIYSMLRTSRDDTPVCKRVYDIPLSTITSHYEGRRYFVDETLLHPSSWTHFQMQTYTSIDYIKIIKQDSVTNYTEFPLEDFLYSVNGTERQYYIPYGYYVMTHFDLNTNPMTSCYVWKPQDETFGLFIKYNFASSTPTVVWMASVSVSNGIVDTTTFNEEDILETDFIFVHYGISEEYVSFIDNGMYGESCSLEEVIYAGGQVILPKTLAQKNNTLFLGNYKLQGYSFTEEQKNIIKVASVISFGYSETNVQKGNLGSYYIYDNQLKLSSKEITTFKGGEVYYFGVVFQDKNGQWSDVVPLGNYVNPYYVYDDAESFKTVKAYVKINTLDTNGILDSFVNAKIVVANINNTIVCQGVLCPTIFSKNRESNSPYAQASWYFRDVRADGVENNRPQAKPFYNIVNNYSDSDSVLAGEIQYANETRKWYYSYNGDYGDISNYDRFVDWNTITLNSPEIDFSTINTSDLSLRIVGVLPITGGVSSRTIDLETLPASFNDMAISQPDILNNNNSVTGYEIELCNYNYQDRLTDSSSSALVDMPIYPWHRTVSLHCKGTQVDDTWLSTIKTKIMASLRTSSRTLFVDNKMNFPLYDVHIFNKEDSLSKFIKTISNTNSMYNGAVDDLLTSESSKINYYKWNGNITYDSNTHSSGVATSVSMKYKSTSHAVMSLKSESGTSIELLPNLQIESGQYDIPISSTDTDSSYFLLKCIDIGTVTGSSPFECSAFSMVDFFDNSIPPEYASVFNTTYNYLNNRLVGNYPTMLSHVWRTANLIENGEFPEELTGNNNGLKDSVFSGSVSSLISTYNLINNEYVIIKYTDGSNTYLTLCRVLYTVDTAKIIPVRWRQDIENFNNKSVSWYNTETLGVLYKYIQQGTEADDYRLYGTVEKYNINVRVKYYSNSNQNINYIVFKYSLFDFIYWAYRENPWTGNWILRYNGEQNHMHILKSDGYLSEQASISTDSVTAHSPSLTLPDSLDSDQAYLYLAELYINNYMLDESVYKNVNWTPASTAFKINSAVIPAELGDTYYQRYDCLKTFPYTHEDVNQIIEIFSFMCETRVNIDGRYDQYRGLSDNTVISEERFNLCNMAYTQKDNIFSYHYLDSYLFSNDVFPNRILWTKTKNYGEEIDSWTQIQTVSELDMDGVLGPVSTLRLFNDNLLCWQSKGLARIQYNERNAISTSSGVPVELANSGKVDGKNYISTSVGTDNMMSVQITPTGVYFVDTNTKDIYQFSGEGLVSISKAKGFNTYMNDSSLNLKRSRTFYDPKLQDVYFENTFTSKTECLVFNEQLKEFTSFFDYDMSFLFYLQDSIIATKGSSLYKQFDGDYLEMFGNVKNYSIEFIANEYPLYDKMFTNFELRADVLNPNTGALVGTTTPYTSSANLYPFKTIKVWNEYQNTGNVNFEEMIRKGTNMSQRFRVWRGDIPRDSEKRFDRIRNTWARVKLTGDNKKIKTVLHDVNIIYYQ